ncbi:hypothetical protein MACH26_14250 [Planctobacterium marinum]|uniref:GIY-YIG domain-containing protein n=1 Tax=Planctobacterium marinum TaxID=1631968 RepID=A0AA48HIG5_9ALTE|nr:hypothetical protein MACH26_14250 [Planctobacterium marinum]
MVAKTLMWFVYLLRVQQSQALYCGISNDLEARIASHRKGTGAKYLRNKPFELVWFMALEGRSLASKYEYQIKRLPKKEKERLVQNAPHPVHFDFSDQQ